MKVRFYCDVKRVPYCCGAYEAGNFVTRHWNSDEAFKRDIRYEDHSLKEYEDAITPELYKRALDRILAAHPGRTIQFWFYKQANYDGSLAEDYTEDKFRQQVMAHPDAVELAEYVNPNSNNMINGWMIKNQLTMETQNKEEDDD